MVVVVVVVGVGDDDLKPHAYHTPQHRHTGSPAGSVNVVLHSYGIHYMEERQLPSRRRQHRHRRSSVKAAPIRRALGITLAVSSPSSHGFDWCLRLAGRPPPGLGVGFCPAMSLRRLSRTCRLIAYCVHTC